MKPIFLDPCPRCGERGFEALKTHSYCVSCNYAPEFEREFYLQVPNEVVMILGEPKVKKDFHSAQLAKTSPDRSAA